MKFYKRRYPKRTYRKRKLRRRFKRNPIFNKYPLLSKFGRTLTYTWADKRTYDSSVSNFAPDTFTKPFNIFNKLTNIEATTGNSFLMAPDYCVDEVNATVNRYKLWRIKSVKFYITEIMITDTQAAQAPSAANGKSKVGVIYHYDDAISPPNFSVDNPYIKFYSLPLRKPIKVNWYARQKGWFDNRISGDSGTVGNVKFEYISEKFDSVKLASSDAWEDSGKPVVTDNGKISGIIPHLNGLRLASMAGDNYVPTNNFSPQIMNNRMPKLYLAYCPDWKPDNTAVTFSYKLFQYVTLQFRENTEIWK